MHVGRISHPENTPHGRQPVAPSAIRPAGVMFTASGPQEMPTPRPLSTEEVAASVDDFRRAAAASVAAGADGVEIHAANGYLVHQFLSENTNQRTDRYGGSIDNRIRFAVEVATAVATRSAPSAPVFESPPATPTTTSPSPTQLSCIRRSCTPSVRWASLTCTSSTLATTHCWARFATSGRARSSSTAPAQTCPPAPRTSRTEQPN